SFTFTLFNALGNPVQAHVLLDNVSFGILKLLPPVPGGDSQSDRTPLLQWKVLTGEQGTSKVYVSTFPAGSGLFPSDTPPDAPADHVINDDANFTRIVNGVDVVAATQFTLPVDRQLTAGQTYFWGVEFTTTDGTVYRASAPFQTRPPAPAASGPPAFSSVTLLTHGFDVATDAPAVPAEFEDLAKFIAQRGGDGVVEEYNPGTGRWDGPAPQPGKPLVLLLNWVADAREAEAGFTEDAADAIFGALVGLNGQAGVPGAPLL